MVHNKKGWRAVYTKPRSEKKIADRLAARGLEVYCPVQTTLRQWSDRKKKVSEPIFPSYLFLRLSDLETPIALEDPGVLNFVYWLGKPAIIRDEEMNEVKLFLDKNRDRTFELIQFTKGEKVEITAGPFHGSTGTVDRIKSNKVSLKMESLGLIIRIEVSPDELKAKR